jgi:hypothetical protein
MWDDGVLTVKTTERDALAAEDPDAYFGTAHHDRSPLLLLVRLDRIDAQTLQELLVESHRLVIRPPTTRWPDSAVLETAACGRGSDE